MLNSKRTCNFFVGMILILSLMGCNGKTTSTIPSATPIPTQPDKKVELMVSAAASLTESINEIKSLYEKRYSNVKIICNFGASGSLQNQIEQGVPCDLFISASPKQINALKEKGLLIDETIVNLLKNKLSLIAPKDSTISIGFKELTENPTKKIAVGEPKSVPVGQYSEEVFKKLNIIDKISEKLIFAKDVKEVLTWVETGNVDAGIVYESDAKTSNKIRILATASEDLHSPIMYPEAIIKESKNIQVAKDFLKYLSEDEAKQVFNKNGYTVISK